MFIIFEGISLHLSFFCVCAYVMSLRILRVPLCSERGFVQMLLEHICIYRYVSLFLPIFSLLVTSALHLDFAYKSMPKFSNVICIDLW